MTRSLQDFMLFRIGDVRREKADETPEDDRRREIAMRSRRRSYRKYPGRIFRPPPGVCRWCGLQINDVDGNIDRTKRFCGPICKTHHDLRADPQKMRRHVFFRDHGICDRCGFQHKHYNGAWEADHVRPLFIAYQRPEFWDPENVVVLCIFPCHRDKTQEDRRRYRKKKKPLPVSGHDF